MPVPIAGIGRLAAVLGERIDTKSLAQIGGCLSFGILDGNAGRVRDSVDAVERRHDRCRIDKCGIAQL